jgi:hypothetical protein
VDDPFDCIDARRRHIMHGSAAGGSPGTSGQGQLSSHFVSMLGAQPCDGGVVSEARQLGGAACCYVRVASEWRFANTAMSFCTRRPHLLKGSNVRCVVWSILQTAAGQDCTGPIAFMSGLNLARSVPTLPRTGTALKALAKCWADVLIWEKEIEAGEWIATKSMAGLPVPRPCQPFSKSISWQTAATTTSNETGSGTSFSVFLIRSEVTGSLISETFPDAS